MTSTFGVDYDICTNFVLSVARVHDKLTLI